MITPTIRVMRPDGKGYHLVNAPTENAPTELDNPATEETTPKVIKHRRTKRA